MMNKEQKKLYIEDMSSQFDKTEAVIVTHYQGLTVAQLDDLRKKMREHGIKFKIIPPIKAKKRNFITFSLTGVSLKFMKIFSLFIPSETENSTGFFKLLKDSSDSKLNLLFLPKC